MPAMGHGFQRVKVMNGGSEDFIQASIGWMVSWKIRKKMDDSGVPPTSIYKLATNESPYSQSVAHMWIPLVMTNIDIENRPSIVDYAINLY